MKLVVWIMNINNEWAVSVKTDCEFTRQKIALRFFFFFLTVKKCLKIIRHMTKFLICCDFIKKIHIKKHFYCDHIVNFVFCFTSHVKSQKIIGQKVHLEIYFNQNSKKKKRQNSKFLDWNQKKFLGQDSELKVRNLRSKSALK